jgi:hypothetical protein
VLRIAFSAEQWTKLTLLAGVLARLALEVRAVCIEPRWTGRNTLLVIEVKSGIELLTKRARCTPG